MITQELVAFIKQQLQEGKSKEQIANILTPHGWELVDINAVFAQLLPTAAPIATQQVPITQSPINQSYSTQQVTQSDQYAETNVTTQSIAPGIQLGMQGAAQPVVGSVTINTVQQTVPTGTVAGSGFMYSFKNPTGIFAGIILVLSTIIGTLLLYYTNLNQGIAFLVGALPIDQKSIIGVILASLMVGIIINGLITKLITKIFSIVPRTFAQAFTFSSVTLLVNTLALTLTIFGVHIIVPVLMGVIFWTVFFWYYYGISIGKAVGAVFLNVLAGIIIPVALIAISVGMGIGSMVTIMNGFKGGEGVVQTVDQVIKTSNNEGGQSQVQAIALADQNNQNQNTGDSSSTTESFATDANSVTTDAAAIGSATSTGDVDSTSSENTENTITKNPEFAHVKDALPVGFPLPKDEQVITAAVLSANTYEGIRYILEYTSTNSLAYLRNNMKSALEKAGYTYSINEKDLNHRVITATQVVRDSVRSFRIELKQVGTTDATVKLVFNQ